jgi:hypothetical protein
MTEPESMMQTRGMSGKAKAVFKRSKAEAPSETAGTGQDFVNGFTSGRDVR